MFEKKWTYGEVFREATYLFKEHINWILLIAVFQPIITGVTEGFNLMTENSKMGSGDIAQLFIFLGLMGLIMMTIVPLSMIINFVLLQNVFTRYGTQEKPLGKQFKDACWNALSWFGCSLLIGLTQAVPIAIILGIGVGISIATESMAAVIVAGVIGFIVALPFMVMSSVAQFETIYYKRNPVDAYTTSFKMAFKKGLKFAPWLIFYLVVIGLTFGGQMAIDKFMSNGIWLKMGISFIVGIAAVFYNLLYLVQYMVVDGNGKDQLKPQIITPEMEF